MEIKAKLYLVDSQGDKFMGIGVLWLLQQVALEGSLRQAAAKLGISYSKAFNMVRHLERNLGMAVIERKKGGSAHHGASLTEFGSRFLALYDDFQAKAKQTINGPFETFMHAYRLLEQEFSGKE